MISVSNTALPILNMCASLRYPRASRSLSERVRTRSIAGWERIFGANLLVMMASDGISKDRRVVRKVSPPTEARCSSDDSGHILLSVSVSASMPDRIKQHIPSRMRSRRAWSESALHLASKSARVWMAALLRMRWSCMRTFVSWSMRMMCGSELMSGKTN